MIEHLYKVVCKSKYGGFISSYNINPNKIAYSLKAWSHAPKGQKLFAFDVLNDSIKFRKICSADDFIIFKCLYQGEIKRPSFLTNSYTYIDDYWDSYNDDSISFNSLFDVIPSRNIIEAYSGTVLVDSLKPIEVYNEEKDIFDENLHWST